MTTELLLLLTWDEAGTASVPSFERVIWNEASQNNNLVAVSRKHPIRTGKRINAIMQDRETRRKQ